MIKRIQVFLGPTLSRVLVIWLLLTGFISLVLNSVVQQYDWVRPVQSLLALAFVLGAVIIFFIRLPPDERGRWSAILVPAVLALAVGLTLLPQYSTLLIGAALGWVVAGLFLSRSRMPIAYREAIKHLRKQEYAESAKVMDKVIRAEPDNPQHYKFRAEVYRLSGKLKQAIRDYEKMTELVPDSPIGYNGLSEVHLQSGNYAEALKAAERAHQLAPSDWVTLYNLGMIEDRLLLSQSVIDHLARALALKVKDVRHRLLIHFYLLRAYVRLGQISAAEEHLAALKRHGRGLDEWQTILEAKEAETLRAVIGADVAQAANLMGGQIKLNEWQP